MPTGNTLKDVFIDQLRDLYDAETQLIKALPKMAKAADNNELRAGFEEHLEQTKGHVRRIELIFQSLDEPAKGKKCKGMQGLIAEGKEVINDDWQGAVADAALIPAAQRVEHYEIAAYGTARTFADLLGEEEASKLLQQTLAEEKETDAKLTQIAEKVNPEAMQGSSAAEQGEERPHRHAKTAGAA
jgi:ferritin-like metal-binding protein YciE